MSITMDPRHTTDFDVVGAVREATTSAKTRVRAPSFSLSKGKPAETAIAVVLGLYLAYAVGRLPEVFPKLQQVPHLPMALMVIFLALLGFTVPSTTWKALWQKSITMRRVTYLGMLGVATVPFGIWPSGSLYFFRTVYIIPIAIFFCCLIFLRDRRNLRRAIAIYVFCMGLTAADVLYNTYHSPTSAVERDQYGNLVSFDANAVEAARIVVGDLDPNDFGAILAITFPLALWLGHGNLRRRFFWGVIALCIVAAVVPTVSRGAELGFGAVATVLIGIGARGWRRIVTGCMVAVGVGLFLYTAKSGQMDRFTNFGSNDYNLTSTDGRWYFWRQGFVWMLKRPWGYGLDNFGIYFGILNGKGRAAHSAWVQYGMELGVAGITIFVTLLFGLVKRLQQLRRRAQLLSLKDPVLARQEDVLASHVIAMLVGFMVTGTFLSIAYVPLTYMCIGIGAATVLGTALPEPEPESSLAATPAKPSNTRRIRRRAVITRAR